MDSVFKVLITLSICFLLSNLVRSVRRFPTGAVGEIPSLRLTALAANLLGWLMSL